MPNYVRNTLLGFILLSSVAWAMENLYFLQHASDRATKACAGRTSILGGSNAYYWCVQRVEAGGVP